MLDRKPLRIVKVLPFFAPRFGGSVTQARLLCAELAVRGHQVSVLTSDLGEPADLSPGAWTDVDGYRVYCAPTESGRQRAVPYPPPAGLLRELTASLRQADVLCTNVGLSLTGVRAGAAARSARVGYVYNAEGALCPQRLRQKGWRKAMFLRVYERRLLKGAAVVQALTAKDADDNARQGADRERIFVVPNGVPLRSVPVDDGAVRRRCGLGEATAVLLFVGRLAPIKGIDLALRAAAPLLSGEDAAFLLAGPDDGIESSMRQLASDLGIADKVHWLGEVDSEQRDHLLATADLFVHTSRSEGLPMAVLEAAAAGLPLWLTDACNMPEVTEYEAGTVDPVDVAALHHSLARLMAEVSWRKRCARNARRMVVERFSLDTVADRLETVYRAIAGHRSVVAGQA